MTRRVLPSLQGYYRQIFLLVVFSIMVMFSIAAEDWEAWVSGCVCRAKVAVRSRARLCQAGASARSRRLRVALYVF
jgi:hypothetical protein